MTGPARSITPKAAELRRLLDAAARLADLSAVDPTRGEAGFCEHAVAALVGLLDHGYPSCELIGLNAAGPPSVVAGHTQHPIDASLYGRLNELLATHPLLHAWVSSGCDGLQWTGPRAKGGHPIHRARIYDEVYRWAGIEHQALPSVRLDARRSLTAMMSSDEPFQGRELKLLELLRPHLAGAWRTFEAIIAVHAASTPPSPGKEAAPDPGELMRRFGLPRRRAEVLALLCEGNSNRAMAARLGLRLGTVRKHVELLLLDLSVADRHEAVRRVRTASNVFQDGLSYR